jgi:hypothetical protein
MVANFVKNEKGFNPTQQLAKRGLLNFVRSSTSFLDNHYQDIKDNQRLWHFENNLFEIKNCEFCEKPAVWTRPRNSKTRTFTYGTCGNKECNLKKQRKSLKDNYGVENPLQNPLILKKHKDLLVEKFGCANPMSNVEVKEKQNKKVLELYGKENYNNSDEDLKKYKEEFEKDNPNYIFLKKIKSDLFLKSKICNHEFQITTHVFYNRRIIYKLENCCTICTHSKMNVLSSLIEKECCKFVKTITELTVIENTKKIITPYEIDIFLPQIGLAIEFNGTYFHADPRFYGDVEKISGIRRTVTQIRERDELKKQMILDFGYRYHVVWEYDWINNQEVEKNKLKELIIK